MPQRPRPKPEDVHEFPTVPAGKVGKAYRIGSTGPVLHAVATMPAGVYLDLSDDPTFDEVYRFIRGCTAEADRDALDATLHSAEHLVELTTLVVVMNWMLDRDGAGLTPFARPAPLASANGSAPTGHG